MKSIAPILVVVFVLLALGCQSPEARLEGFFLDFSKEYFKKWPDSAAIAGRWTAPERLLEPPTRAVFSENRAWLDEARQALEKIDTAQFSTKNKEKWQLLAQKIGTLSRRTEIGQADASLFDPLLAWQAALQNREASPSQKRAAFEALLVRTPAYLAGAVRLGPDFFDKKSFEKSALRTLEALRFLKKESPEGLEAEAARLALKDWLAFCESWRPRG